MDNEPKITSSNIDAFISMVSEATPVFESGNISRIQSFVKTIMQVVSLESDLDASQELKLCSDAHTILTQGDWLTAENLHRERLTLPEVIENPMWVFKVHSDLCHLYAYVGNNYRALEEAELGLKAARTSPMVPVLCMAFSDTINSYLTISNPIDALKYSEELMGLLAGNNKQNIQTAMAYTLNARCNAQLGEVARAKQDLESAWIILSPLAGARILAGNQSKLAYYWEVTAQLRTMENDHHGAIEAYIKAVDHRQAVTESPYLSGPYYILRLVKTLEKLEESYMLIGNSVHAEDTRNSCVALKRFINYPM